MQKDVSITAIKGIGAKTAGSFAKMGVYTVGDILLRFPRTYIQYPKPEPVSELAAPEAGGGLCAASHESSGHAASSAGGGNCASSHESGGHAASAAGTGVIWGAVSAADGRPHAVAAKVRRSPTVRRGGRMQVTVLEVGGELLEDGSQGQRLQLVWYRMPYIKSSLTVGHYYVFYGRITVKSGKYVMEQPAVYEPETYEQMQDCFFPVYSLTAGITNNLMTKTIRTALSDSALCADFLPDWIRREYRLCEYNYAMKQIHFPDTMDTLIEARNRLVFDEFFLFILGMRYQKQRQQRLENAFVMSGPQFVGSLVERLPYTLTGAQQRTLSEVQENMAGPYAMQRLIQGDVGSGKTVIAFLAMAWTAHNGYQSAIMAPTEVLARQHYETYVHMCGQFGLDFPVILLTGSMTARQKRLACERIALQPNAMVIGTHALIQEPVDYNNLALVITDEQHRFGVRQRDSFSEKGAHPHILVMSATPIPRTLAIILYGDMDISVVDEVPARRLPVKNCVVNPGYRPKAYAFIAEQVRLGHQAYVVCPFVEAGENMEGENVNDYAMRLMEELPGKVCVGVLHGQLRNDMKNRVMEQFAANEIQVLVSTTVVEVGVNVPNATVMMVENAERFGLAQLHQLRGRVGRGDAQSYCIMVNTSAAESAQKRLEILNRSNDGFFIAGEDLKLRGPGDFFGIRQSGELAFALADIYQDAKVLKAAAGAADRLLEEDPGLEKEGNERLRDELERAAREQPVGMSL